MEHSPEPRATVARFDSRFEAEVVAARLRDAGFDPAVFADDAGGWEPQMAMSTTVEVKVPGSEVAAAVAFLAED